MCLVSIHLVKTAAKSYHLRGQVVEAVDLVRHADRQCSYVAYHEDSVPLRRAAMARSWLKQIGSAPLALVFGGGLGLMCRRQDSLSRSS